VIDDNLHNLIRISEASQRAYDQFASVMAGAFMKAKQIEEHIASSQAMRVLADSQRAYDQLASGIASAFTKAKEIENQIVTSQAMQAFVASQKTYDRLASGFANAFAKVNQMEEQLASSNIIKWLEKFDSIAEAVRNTQLTINSDGSLSGGGAILQASEIEQVINSCLTESALTTDQIPLEIRIDNFLTTIGKQHPLIIKIIVFILLPFLINVYSNKYYSDSVNNNQAQLIRNIKTEVNKFQLDPHFIGKYRFVATRQLNVWSRGTTKSRLLGKLYFGQVVRIIQKNKNWTLVEYHNETEEVVIKGWVFTRYIKRFD
jgi:hypothetical protein